MALPLPPLEQWKWQYCQCGNQVRRPTLVQRNSGPRWRWHKDCNSCEKLRYRYGFSSTSHVKEVLGIPKCAICGSTDDLRIDHDHSTDRVRAWLCNSCNSGIGYFNEDPSLLIKAIQYCKRHNATSTMVLLCQEMGLKIDDHHIPPNSDAKPEKYKAQPYRQKTNSRQSRRI